MIAVRDVIQAIARSAQRLLNQWNSSPIVSVRPSTSRANAVASLDFQPLKRVRLTHEVSCTLFDEYAAHRKTERGDEETGWLLLGLRDAQEALILATLPAGAKRHASSVHVQFNSSAQALAGRIVRQNNKQLTLLGVVHTHPGSLRHPSDADYRGDHVWVTQLRGKEGIFGIGTADAPPAPLGGTDWRPKPHMQCLGELCFSWYTLREGDRRYRPMPVEICLGPDLAAPLRPVWPAIEAHADRLDRLARMLKLRFEPLAPQADESGILSVQIPLDVPDRQIRVWLQEEEVRYFLHLGDQVLAVDLEENRVDVGVYLLLSELAKRADAPS